MSTRTGGASEREDPRRGGGPNGGETRIEREAAVASRPPNVPLPESVLLPCVMSSHEERSWCSPGEPGGPPWWPAAAPDHFSASHAPDSASLPFGYKVPGHFPGTTASAPGGGPPGVSYHHQTQPQAHWWYPDRQGSDIGQRPLTQVRTHPSRSSRGSSESNRPPNASSVGSGCRPDTSIPESRGGSRYPPSGPALIADLQPYPLFCFRTRRPCPKLNRRPSLAAG